MKKNARERDLEQVKEFLVGQDCDFHQSTGAERIILGVVGETAGIDRARLQALPGVLDVYRIPRED